VIAVYAFAAWTVFVWATRARNIMEDQGSTYDLVVALALALLGVAVVVAARKGGLARVLAVAVVATFVVWAVRTPLMVFDADHDVAFKAVHTALAVVSFGLGLAAWRTTGFWPAVRHGGRSLRRPGQRPRRDRSGAQFL
jgi:hypothetical protein